MLLRQFILILAANQKTQEAIRHKLNLLVFFEKKMLTKPEWNLNKLT